MNLRIRLPRRRRPITPLDVLAPALSTAEAARMVRESWPTDDPAAPLTDAERAAIRRVGPPLPTRTPGAALSDAVARYALGDSPLYPDDELYIAESGALIHVHTLTDEEIR